MRVAGKERQVDFERLGPTLVIAASVILAIRTARQQTVPPAVTPGLMVQHLVTQASALKAAVAEPPAGTQTVSEVLH